jgi:Ca2+-binding EF-hand superfamily protein
MFAHQFSRTLAAGLLLGTTIMAASVYAADPPLTGQAKEIADRFKAADKNHDGKLTLEEAQAGMPRIAAAFTKIDQDNKGYLTLPQIQEVAASAAQ